MGVRPFNVLSLCSGYGGLDLGVGLATGTAVTVCYVEREAYAAALLVARIQDEALDDAPVWSDLRTFDGKPWRGVVDCIIGGYPCQPFSIAGKQRGVDDPRHLWPDIARIIREVRPTYCFFENVRQHINVGLDAVWSDLRAMGYHVEGGIFSAAEVGAPHRRERLFLLAHADEARLEGRHGPLGSSTDKWVARTSSATLAHATSTRREESRPTGIGQLRAEDRAGMDNRSRFDGTELGIFPPGPTDFDEWAAILGEYPDLAPALAHASDERRGATADDPRRQGRQSASIGETHLSHRQRWTANQPDTELGTPGLCAGGSAQETQSPLRGVADGPAPNMAGRAEQLRLGGNGVVPLQAAYAFAVLASRAGISSLLDVMMTRM